MKEMQKPLARYIDDEDLDRMLREQEREGDPMANFIKKNKAKENKNKRGETGSPRAGAGSVKRLSWCRQGAPIQLKLFVFIWGFELNW